MRVGPGADEDDSIREDCGQGFLAASVSSFAVRHPRSDELETFGGIRRGCYLSRSANWGPMRSAPCSLLRPTDLEPREQPDETLRRGGTDLLD